MEKGVSKKEVSKDDFIKWFSELNKDSVPLVGGKGANLAEIYNMNISVPPGFIVTTRSYDYFIKKAGIDKKIKSILSKIDFENTKNLDEATQKIRDLIVKSKMPYEVEEEILESYENLGAEISGAEDIEEILSNPSEEVFVAVRSSATTEDLAGASFAGQQDTFINVKGKTELIESVKKCIASLFTSRAVYYRNKKNFKQDSAKLAVVVQKMVESDKSGVVFSKDPSYKNNHVIIEAVFGFGEGIVSGEIIPDRYTVSEKFRILDKEIADKKTAILKNSEGHKVKRNLSPEKSKSQVLKDSEVINLAEIALKLERHYRKPQDIEFAIEKDEIYIVQTRAITTIGTRIEKQKGEIKGEAILMVWRLPRESA